MENIIFLIFIIVMFLLQAVGQILTRRKRHFPREEKPPQEATLEDILERLGFPMEKPPLEEKPAEIEIEEASELEKAEEVKTGSEDEKIPEPLPDKIPEKEGILSFDKLEEAIIYSAIIGPPKAKQFCRSGEIGRHA